MGLYEATFRLLRISELSGLVLLNDKILVDHNYALTVKHNISILLLFEMFILFFSFTADSKDKTICFLEDTNIVFPGMGYYLVDYQKGEFLIFNQILFLLVGEYFL